MQYKSFCENLVSHSKRYHTCCAYENYVELFLLCKPKTSQGTAMFDFKGLVLSFAEILYTDTNTTSDPIFLRDAFLGSFFT